LRTQCLSLGEAEPDANVRGHLGLGEGDQATLLRTVGTMDGAPVGYFEIWFPLEIGILINRNELTGNLPIIRFVEQVSSIRITRAAQTIGPDVAGPEAAAYLQIAASAPILKVQRVYFAGDRPVEVANVRYHPDRYCYAIEFKD
jgi:GntR family transcriptional regulator